MKDQHEIQLDYRKMLMLVEEEKQAYKEKFEKKRYSAFKGNYSMGLLRRLVFKLAYMYNELNVNARSKW